MNNTSSPQFPLLNYTQAEHLEQLHDEEFWRYAEDIANASSQPTQLSEEYLVCTAQQTRYLFPLTDLEALVPIPQCFTLLPASPPWMFGLITWHNTAIAMVDLLAYFSKTAAQAQPNNMLLIAQTDTVALGLCCTIVGSVDSLTKENFTQPPDDFIAPCAGAIKGVYQGQDGDMMNGAFLLDIPVILTDIAQHVKMTASYA